MKSEKGVSLITLIIYLIAMSTVVAIVARASNYFYKNVINREKDLSTNSEFVKFTSFFTKEINTNDNSIKSIGEEETEAGEIMKYIIECIIENAKEALKLPRNEFNDAKRLAYYEVLNTIKGQLEVNDINLKDYKIDFEIESIL